MEQVNQKEATYNAIISTLKLNNINFEDGVDVKSLLTPELKKTVKAIIFEGFRDGAIAHKTEFTAKLSNDSELTKYCGNLISNWIKKDSRLNGGVKYTIKNPGSRVGHSDDQVKALRNLKKTTNDSSILAEIDKALNERLAEVKAAKNPVAKIDVEVLPEHLRHLVK